MSPYDSKELIESINKLWNRENLPRGRILTH